MLRTLYYLMTLTVFPLCSEHMNFELLYHISLLPHMISICISNGISLYFGFWFSLDFLIHKKVGMVFG